MKKSSYLIGIMTVFSIVSFQNCSQELGQLGGTVNKASDGIPFPIDVQVDTIARMSCYAHQSTAASSSHAYFSYHALSNSPFTSGVVRSTAFDEFVTSKTKAGDNVYANRKKFLTDSKKLNGLQLQFSLKAPEEMSATDYRYARGFTHLNLKDPALIEDLSSFDEPIDINPGSLFQAKLDLRQFDLASADELYTIDNLGSHLTLTLDYLKGTAPEFSVGPYTFSESENTNLIYGNKYKVYLKDLSPRAREKQINTIRQVNAATNAESSAAWFCTNYKIIRSNDVVDANNSRGCSSTTAVDISSSTSAENVRLHRLLGSGWKRYGDCIKHDSVEGCYGNTSVAIEYNLANISSTVQEYCNDTGSTGKICANFLSVCSKSSF